MADDLQFDKVEFSGAARCAAGGHPIEGSWWSVGAQRVCASCKAKIEAELSAPIGAFGYFKALAFGVAAGLAGAIAWGVVTVVTGYEIGIVAIAIAWLVATVMRKGAARGALGLQLLGVVVTYASIALGYVPLLARAGLANSAGPLEQVFAVLLSFPMALALPYFEIQEGVSGILWFVIVGFALLRAWSMLAPARLAFQGPYRS